jgi:hypothetical protein
MLHCIVVAVEAVQQHELEYMRDLAVAVLAVAVAAEAELSSVCSTLQQCAANRVLLRNADGSHVCTTALYTNTLHCGSAADFKLTA